MEAEEVKVTCSTRLSGADDARLVEEAFRNLFPEVETKNFERRPTSFPMPVDEVQWTFDDLNLDHILKIIRENRVLDTALDAMSQSLRGGKTLFRLSRQAALAKKVSFCLPGEQALGGCFDITLEAVHLSDWLEEVTWHRGREEISRKIRDERAMSNDGRAREWFS